MTPFTTAGIRTLRRTDYKTQAIPVRLRHTSGRTSDRAAHRGRAPREGGQTTAEYALVLLAAGTIAMLVVAWAQGNGAIGSLFDLVLSRITSLVE